MQNATLNARSALDSTGGFNSATDLVRYDHNDDDEYGGRKDRFDQEEIDLGERRKYSTMSGKSDMSGVEIPERNSTVDAVERPIFEGIRLDAVRSRSPWMRLLAECVSEFFGTLILVVVGCSGVAQFVLSNAERHDFLSVNFAFGFGAMIAVYVAGPVSGAHINPAVSVAMLTLRAITPLQCITYIVSQFLGAFLAAAIVFGIYFEAINKFDGGVRQVAGPKGTAGIFGTFPAKDVGQGSLFFDQLISTAILLISVCALSNKRNKLVSNSQIPIAVGFVITAIGTAFGYNCGFPINPARDFSPRLFTLCAGYGSGVFSADNYYFWVPCIGPTVGAVIGAWAYHGYSKLMKIHIGEDEQEISRARYQVDIQNVTRM